MSLFSPMVEALFAGPFAVAVSYTAPGEGAPMQSLRGIVSRPDEVSGLFAAGAVVAHCLLDVPVADIAAPQEGAAIAVNGVNYTLAAFPCDAEGLIWKFHLKLAT